MKPATTKAVITGGASGLGEATARHFAENGAQVCPLDRDGEHEPQVSEALGGTFLETDVSDGASASAAIAEATEVMGRITACVNCTDIAGSIKTFGRDGPHPIGAYQQTVDINLVGTSNMSRLAAVAMAEHVSEPDSARGVIINTASITAFDGQKGQASYAASKGGVVGMTLPMARDLASLDIRVTAIAPGMFLTPMLMGLPEDVRTQLASKVPHPPRLGDPREFGRLAGFIIEMGYFNGEVIRLDGAPRMH